MKIMMMMIDDDVMIKMMMMTVRDRVLCCSLDHVWSVVLTTVVKRCSPFAISCVHIAFPTEDRRK